VQGVEKVIDFESKKAGVADPQARDKETGRLLWTVKVIDLDPDGGKFGSSTEVKVKVAANAQPVPPSPQVPGYPPKVEFVGVTLTPYVNTKNNRLAWSVRAEDMVPFGAVVEAVS
jgi:hypothetical protein